MQSGEFCDPLGHTSCFTKEILHYIWDMTVHRIHLAMYRKLYKLLFTALWSHLCTAVPLYKIHHLRNSTRHFGNNFKLQSCSTVLLSTQILLRCPDRSSVHCACLAAWYHSIFHEIWPVRHSYWVPWSGKLRSLHSKKMEIMAGYSQFQYKNVNKALGKLQFAQYRCLEKISS